MAKNITNIKRIMFIARWLTGMFKIINPNANAARIRTTKDITPMMFIF